LDLSAYSLLLDGSLTMSWIVRILKLDALVGRLEFAGGDGDIAALNIPSNRKHSVSTKLSFIRRLKLTGNASFSPERVATFLAEVTTRIWNSSMTARYRVEPFEVPCHSSS